MFIPTTRQLSTLEPFQNPACRIQPRLGQWQVSSLPPTTKVNHPPTLSTKAISLWHLSFLQTKHACCFICGSIIALHSIWETKFKAIENLVLHLIHFYLTNTEMVKYYYILTLSREICPTVKMLLFTCFLTFLSLLQARNTLEDSKTFLFESTSISFIHQCIDW